MKTIPQTLVVSFSTLALLVSASPAQQVKAAATDAAQHAGPALRSIGPIAFGPGHTLLVSDPQAATIWAFDVEGLAGDGIDASAEPIEDFDDKIAALLGTTAQEIRVVDVAVNPQTRQVYVPVLRGRGPDATPVLLRVDKGAKISEVSLAGLASSRTTLSNVPAAEPAEASAGGERRGGRRRRGGRAESITDLAFVDGKVVVAGLSNEEFASKLRVLPFPLGEANPGASVEIFHGAHGRFETNSPVRTFVPYEVDGEPCILAAYTCTPLVVFPVSDLVPGKKITGKTIAELGNRNRPLDMVAYWRPDGQCLLIANSSRGVMKLPTKGIDKAQKITDPVARGDSAGMVYETIEELQGVVQLDRLDGDHALVLISGDNGALTLKVVAFP